EKRYWRPITLRFDDGKEGSFEVDLPTWKANLKQEVVEYRKYRTIMDACGKTGRGRIRWEYIERMDSLLCKDPAVHPVRAISSSKGI
ncbi:hypothetical protein MAR_038268, partial [Mya arenaria]